MNVDGREADVTEMSAQERLLAIEEVKNLRARYCRAIDTKDWNLLRSTLAPDVRLDLPSLRERGGLDGADAFVELVSTWFATTPSLHANYLPEIEIASPSSATGVWQQQHFLPHRYQAEVHHGHGYGYSHDSYEKIEGRWFMKSVRLAPLFEII
jgi:hypothetical protein